MTTYRKPPIGPLLSLVDGAGRSSEWVRYAAGASIACPGRRQVERRAGDRGDRRTAPRFEPCPRKWGRPPLGSVTDVRVHTTGQYGPPPTLLLWCEKCRGTIEFKTHAANEAA